MSWAFPNKRLLPVLVAALGYLVVVTAQRGALLSLVRQEAGASTEDAWRVMVLGTQSDLVAALAFSLPLVLRSIVLPERAWRSITHRRLAAAALFLGALALLGWFAIESLYFVANRTRIGPGARERLEAMLSFIAQARSGMPMALATVTSIALALMAVGLVHVIVRRSFDGPPSRPGARARDLAFQVAALAFFGLVVATRAPEFPGRRTLQELAGNSLTRLMLDQRPRVARLVHRLRG